MHFVNFNALSLFIIMSIFSMSLNRDNVRARPHKETKSIFRPQVCHAVSDHAVSCPNKQLEVTSVYAVPRKIGRDQSVRDYHEDKIAQSLLAINHYRFTDFEDVQSKCAPDTALTGYQVDDCVAKMTEHSNYPEIYDDIMLRKWRRAAEEE